MITMRKRYIVIGLFLLFIASLYINKDVYYISRWGMYIKIENIKDTTTVYISNTRWTWGDNYIKYRPESAEMSSLNLHPIRDTLYAIQRSMEIVEIYSKDYIFKAVNFKRDPLEFDYWSDSTFIKEKPHEWISINHRHGIYKSWQ